MRSCRKSCFDTFKRFQKSFSSYHITYCTYCNRPIICTIPRFSFIIVLLVPSYSLYSLLESLCLRVVLHLDLLKAKYNKSSNIQNEDTGLRLTAKSKRLTKPARRIIHKIGTANIVIWNLRTERDGVTILKPSQA